jgi:hypothetical protein
MQAYCVKCRATKEVKVEVWEVLLSEWRQMERVLGGPRSFVPRQMILCQMEGNSDGSI